MSVLDKYRPTTGSSKGWKPTPPKAVVPKKKGIIESAFDKENYVEKFKRGDIKGGIANFVGSPLRALQSGYLNLLDAPHALYHGERPTFKYNMDYEDFEKEVARRGGVTPVSERIKNPALRSIYKMGMEIGTDPIELTPLGFYKDIQRARAGSQATRGYLEALQSGKLVPKDFKPATISHSKAKVVKPAKAHNIIKETGATAKPYNITKKPSATIKPLNPESKFVFDMPKKKTSFKETGQKFRSSFVDSSAAIRDAEIDIRGVKKARLGAKVLPDAEKSLYKTIALSKGSPEKAIYRIKENLVPTVRAYEKSGGKARHLSMYAEAVHAKDINKAGLKSGLSNAEIDTLIKKYGTPEAEKARQALVKYNDDLLKDLAGSGVIGQNEYKAMREKWPNYMPINRVMDDDKVELADGIRKALFEGHKPIKSLRGSERKIIDPIVSMAKNTYKYETAIGKGAINKQIVAFAKDDTAGKYIRRLEKGADTYRKNVVSILEDGKKVQFEASPEVYRALKDLDKESSSMLINILSQPASVLRAGAVLTPDFATKNFIRDNFQAFINSESGYVPMVDFVRGLASYFKKDQYYVDFIKSRGAFGIITDMDKDAYMVAQNLVVNQPMGKKFVNVLNPKKWLDVLRDVTEVSEYGTRLGEYKAALRKGASKAEAAYRARDLQDFMRAGSQTKIANRVVPFLNADIQGKSRILRALKERPVEAGTKLLAMMAGPSIAAQAMNHVLANEDQKAMLKDTPQWQKDIFWLVAIPGTNTIARIPKPFEGAPISMVIERFFDKVANEDEQAFDGILEDMARDQMIPVMPTAFGPIVESLVDYSFFMDMPVVPQRMENLERQDQHDYRTSEPAKALAKVLSYVFGEDSRLASPMAAQHMIKGYTAGLGEYVTDGIDLLTGNRKKPYPNIPQMPVVKSFTINPHSGGKSSDFIYSELNKLTKAKNSRPDEFKEEPQRKFLSYTQKELSALAKEIREVQNSDKLTGKQKRDKLNILYPKRNKLAQKAQEDYKKINEITERLSKTIKDEDELIREVNRTMYGAKEALKRYDKSVYERAVKSRVPYDKFYEAYFTTRNIESDKINGKSISAGSKEEMQGLGESASLKTRRAIDSIKGLSDEDRRKLYDIFNVAKSIKNRTIILPIKR